MTTINYSKYLPLSEATFYVMVALSEPMHGYAIMQKVETISEGNVVIGPGTLYGAFTTLEKQGLIIKVKEEERRKSYALTELGQQILTEQIRRLEIMVKNGQLILKYLQQGAVK
ncbi:PadR family transcriptional regulator [Undibacterium sp. 5I1]|nr:MULTISPECIES: PadR family transcriptional regulator [unclassified Undibacterium]MDY7539682.1 PadR family transcriptional regulator [Undibacterium sp. 5I1]MEB0230888.1 PadR family transcriptional regulator [Undibacterium sp. 10I3]MEB0257457.1 PadR family transcriptional regulator [Undibacterium sp. 5I1]